MKVKVMALMALATAVSAGGAIGVASGAAAADLDPTKPADSLTMMRKIFCSTVDGEPTTYYWFGKAYSRRQGERDRHIFNVEGMNVRACKGVEGGGFDLVSREILLYKDPATDKVLATWQNPWTGESVDVLHVANDPVNGKFRPTDRAGQPTKFGGVISGDVWWMTSTVPLYYPNPLASDYESEIGGTYHATEMFNFFGNTASLLDPEATHAEGVTVGWSRMSDWLPWMKMAGREGVIYMHTAGKRLGAWDELSDTMKSEIRKHYPDYVAPPPLDDPRPNVTSWKYYKAVRDGDVDAPKRK
ncbi:MAG: DUF1838 domain-containing protein [Alphaproteobacteria bacterium]|nr:DUF1838 domain-containing protein [Alphaproteobacteria bacterium]